MSSLGQSGSFFFISFLRFLAEIQALLLSDMIVLLQEKDQKLVFASVVSPPQIPPPRPSGCSCSDLLTYQPF